MQRRKAFLTVYQALTGKPGDLNCDFAQNSLCIQTLRGCPLALSTNNYIAEACRPRTAGETREKRPHDSPASSTVLISLIYLALQVRQAEKNQQASIRQGRATRAVDIILAAGDPALAEALPKEPPARRYHQAEFGQFAAIYGAFLASAEDTWLQHKEGLLSEAVFASFARAGARRSRSPACARCGRCAASASKRASRNSWTG